MVIGGLSVESVAMFDVSALLFIFLVTSILCVYWAHRYGKLMITPHCSEVHQHPISARFKDTENEPNEAIKTQMRSLTSSPIRKLEVIIEHQEEKNSPIVEL